MANIQISKKLQNEINWLNTLKNNYISGSDAQIYDRILKIAKMDYLSDKDGECKRYQEIFFISFMTNDYKLSEKCYNNYSCKSYNKALLLRRKIDPHFLPNVTDI